MCEKVSNMSMILLAFLTVDDRAVVYKRSDDVGDRYVVLTLSCGKCYGVKNIQFYLLSDQMRGVCGLHLERTVRSP